ncbi:MAG: RHS repeat protein [Verrucomicrobia bacterium]|nr:RHS repeat protein [Verrucomicrobiota bacterium]
MGIPLAQQHGAPGRIARIADRHGNQLSFTYDTSHRLTEIIDTLGRTNRLGYDPVGRVRTLTDFSGRTFTYTYYREQDAGGSEGDLQSCTTPPVVGTPNTNDFPLGKTTAYTYSEGFPDARLNRNLLSLTDAKNQVCVSLSYHPTIDPADVNYDRVAAVQRGVNPPAPATYVPQTPAASNRWAVLKVLCNDPVGNVTIDWFDSLNRNIIHRDLAARATAGTPLTESTLPIVKLRDSDPDYWETTYEWTPDSLCSRVTYPGSNSVEIVHQRAACHNSSRSNKTSRHSDGNPIVVHAVSRRVIGPDMEPDLLTLRATFHQEFGPSRPQRRTGRTYQNQTDKDIISRHIQLPDDQSGDVIIAADFPGSGINEKTPDTWLHFATRVVDSRGSVTECLCGSEGTRIRVTRSGPRRSRCGQPRHRIRGDAFGQLTACVLAADATGHRRRDELAWNNGRITQVTQDTTASAHVLQIVRDGLGRPSRPWTEGQHQPVHPQRARSGDEEVIHHPLRRLLGHHRGIQLRRQRQPGAPGTLQSGLHRRARHEQPFLDHALHLRSAQPPDAARARVDPHRAATLRHEPARVRRERQRHRGTLAGGGERRADRELRGLHLRHPRPALHAHPRAGHGRFVYRHLRL